MSRWVVLGLMCGAAACSPDARGLTWTVVFEDPEEESRAVLFEGVVAAGDCAATAAGPSLYQHEFTATQAAPAVPVLAPGTYSLSVRARDGQCRWYARGCTTVTLPQAVGHEALVVLFAAPEEAACPEQCTAGLCARGDAGAPDASDDAAVTDSSAPDSGETDSGAVDSSAMDSGPPDTGPPDTGPADTGTPDTFVPECSRDSDCGGVTYRRTGGWSCRADGALDRAPFEFTTAVCNSGRCGTTVETQTLECRCRDDICSSSGCNDVSDSSSRCDDGTTEGPCPTSAVMTECHR